MELTLAQVAAQTGRGERFVQQAVREGDLSALRLVGRLFIVDDLAVAAWARSLARGRRWVPAVKDAALDLLTSGRTSALSASERSRLKSRLASMTAAAIAHASGGLGEWARYRVGDVPDLPRVGPSALDSASLGVVDGGGWVTFDQCPSLSAFELSHDALLDADGNLGVVERRAVDERRARVLLETYLLGDVRLSAAAGRELEGRAHGS